MPAKLSSRKTAGFKTASNQIAARYRSGAEKRVLAALRTLGTVETCVPKRMVVLHRGANATASAVTAAMEKLKQQGLIEFVTPVLIDLESKTRQVLTDEIVIQLKPGRTQRALAALTAKHGVSIGKQSEFEPSQFIVTVPKPTGMQTLDVARLLDKSADVEFASPNFLAEFKR